MKKTLIVLILISLFASLAINPQQIKADDNSVNTIVAMKNAYDFALSLNENNKVDSSYKLLTNDTFSYYLYFTDTIYQQIHEDNTVKLSNESNAYNNAEVVYEIQGDTLHINGSGPIDDFSGSNKAPWYEYRDTITNIVIDEGVTSIGDQAFISFTNLDYLVLPNTITSIGEGAFYECSNLKTVILPNSLTTILEGAFCDCSCLRYITIPSSVNYIGEEALLDCDPNLIVYIHDNDYAKQYCIDNDLSYVEVDSYFVLDKISVTPPSKLNYEYNEELDLTGLEVYEVYSSGNYSIPIRINDGYTVSDYNKQQSGQQKITVAYKTFNAYFNVNVSRGNIIQSGTCGDQINFYLYEGGVLKIEGNGPMNDYFYSSPWYKYNDFIYNIELVYGITSIGNYAFYRCKSLKSINIPDSVTSIGSGAFSDCSSLTSIAIPDSVTSIGSGAFSDCSSLTSIAIPNSVTSIGGSAFSYCYSLTSITIPDSVTEIGYGAFSHCSHLTSIAIPDSVTSIGGSAFSYCYSLTSITIPNSVTSIGDSAFRECSSLTSLTMPISASITSNSFTDVYNLKEVRLTKGTGKDVNYGYTPWYNSRETLTSLVLDDGITSIGDYAFSDCSSLTSLTMPISTSIASNSFTNVSNLKEIRLTKGTGKGVDYTYSTYQYTPWYISRNKLTSLVLDDDITSIGDYTFYDCTSLKSLTMPISASIASESFTNVSNLKEVRLTKGTGKGVNYTYPTFQDNTPWYRSSNNLTTLVLDDGVTSIGDYTFSYCSSLTSITIPDSVTSIGNFAFRGCSSLTSITIPDSVTSIGDSAFSECSSLTSITILGSVTSIGSGAFQYCSNLASIYVDNNNPIYSSIDGVLFEKTNNIPTKIVSYPNNKSDTSYNIPDSVTSIGSSAFYGCTSLTSITIPDSVTSIDGGAFFGCSSLTSITISDSVTSIGSYAFQGCSSLTSIDVDSNNPKYGSIDGVLFEKTNNIPTKIVSYPNNKSDTSYNIPNSVTSIGSGAFYDCSSLTSITIPDSVTSIGDTAFYFCSSLTSITIPDSVTSIGGYAFGFCSSLTSITIPDSVTSIASNAFFFCSNNLKIYGYDNDYLKQYCEDNNLTYATLNKIKNKTLNGTLLQNGTIRLNLSVDIDEDVSLDNAYALINGNKVKLERNDQGKVIVHTSGLAPKNINDNITIRYYDENDNPISSNIELNVRDYIETLLSGYLNKKTKAFYKSLLNYGAYAQELFEYNTDNLANSTLEDIDKDLSDVTYDIVSTHAPNIVGSTEGISAYGQSLVLKDEVDFRVYFLLDGSHSIDEYIFTDGETKLNPIKQSNNIFYVTISKNAAPDLDKNHTISVNLNNAGDLKVSTSVLAYCEMTLRKDPVSQEDIKLANFVKAIYKYSLAAKNLLGE